MKVVLIFVLKIFFVSFVSAATPAVPTHYCFIGGQMIIKNSNYQLSEPDLPDRCQVIVYGKYSFDASSAPLAVEDENAIKALVTAKRTVYMLFGYHSQGLWQELFNPPDPNTYTTRKSELVTKLTDLGISGVVIDLQLETYKTYADKISKFIKDVKAEIPTLKIGIPVVGIWLYNMVQSKKA